MKYRLVLLAWWWLSLLPARADTPIRIAVLDFTSMPENPTLEELLADDVRGAILLHTYPEKVLILTKENMLSVLDDMGKSVDCIDDSCEVELARSLSADYVFSGRITEYGGAWYFTIKLFESKRGILLATKKIQRSKDTELLEDTLDEVSEMLTEANLDARFLRYPKNEQTRESPISDSSNKSAVQQDDRSTSVEPTATKREQRNHGYRFQCHGPGKSWSLIGVCSEGKMLGVIQLGTLIYSGNDDFVGGMQFSLLNQTKNDFWGVMQVGLWNQTKGKHHGIQYGLINETQEHLYGLQIGVINRVDKVHGIQLGLVNRAEHVYGVQYGLFNSASYLHGIQLGVINMSTYTGLPFMIGINIGI